METIRNYLETMFASLPASPEVKKAKEELLNMMEDKYNELIGEGKPENEAVASVIADFGNLSEISETLGIGNVIEEQSETDKEYRMVTLEESKGYLNDFSQRAFLNGLSVMLFVTCAVWPILSEKLVVLMFVNIACGVGLSIYKSSFGRKWRGINKKSCMIDYHTADYLQEKFKENQHNLLMTKIIGIICCICCVVPTVIFDAVEDSGSIAAGYLHMGNIGAALMFIILGIGIWMIITSAGKQKAYRNLLGLNSDGLMADTFVSTDLKDVVYKNEALTNIMSCYWFTVTCLYLMVSFLTFAWGITWIIWPIAVGVNFLIKALGKKEVE